MSTTLTLHACLKRMCPQASFVPLHCPPSSRAEDGRTELRDPLEKVAWCTLASPLPKQLAEATCEGERQTEEWTAHCLGSACMHCGSRGVSCGRSCSGVTWFPCMRTARRHSTSPQKKGLESRKTVAEGGTLSNCRIDVAIAKGFAVGDSCTGESALTTCSWEKQNQPHSQGTYPSQGSPEKRDCGHRRDVYCEESAHMVVQAWRVQHLQGETQESVSVWVQNSLLLGGKMSLLFYAGLQLIAWSPPESSSWQVNLMQNSLTEDCLPASKHHTPSQLTQNANHHRASAGLQLCCPWPSPLLSLPVYPRGHIW